MGEEGGRERAGVARGLGRDQFLVLGKSRAGEGGQKGRSGGRGGVCFRRLDLRSGSGRSAAQAWVAPGGVDSGAHVLF